MTVLQFLGYARKFTIALGAAIAVAVVAVSDNIISYGEWLQIAAAFLGALGVFIAPNKEVK